MLKRRLERIDHFLFILLSVILSVLLSVKILFSGEDLSSEESRLATSWAAGATRSLGALTQPEAIKFEHLSPDDGLAQIIVGTIIQDSRGFMWFGTRGGLNRYDGYKFELFENDPENPHSISSNSIYHLYEDHMGVLWAGTSNGLNKFDHKTGRFTVYKSNPNDPHSLSGNIVWSILEDSNKILWIGTHDGGLNEFEREKNRFVRFRHNPRDLNSLSSDYVETVYEDKQHNLWVGTKNGLNRLISRQKGNAIFTRYEHDPDNPSSLSGNHIRSIYEDHAAALWIGTRYNGLNRFDRDTGKVIRYRHDPKNPYSLGPGTVWTLHEDRKNILWIGCYGGGLNRFDRENNRFIRYKHNAANPDSICGNMVEAIYEDDLGALWIGTWDNGISKYDREAAKFKLYTHDPDNKNSLSNRNVRSVCEDPGFPGRVFWVGTQEGGLNRFDKAANTWTHFRHDPGNPNSISSDAVSPIYADAGGILWIGTQGGGLNRFNPETGKFSVYKNDPDNPDSLSNNQVRTLAEYPEGVLWVGTSNGLNKFEIKTETFTRYFHDPENPNSLGGGFCLRIHVDKTGIIWIGHRGGGLDRFDPGTETFNHYLHDSANPNGISDNDVWSIYEDAAGTLWLGTGKGLNKFDPKTGAFIHYRKKDGLSSDSIAGILPDNRGFLWLGTRGGGLIKFDPETGNCKNYNSSDGLQSNELPENWICKSQTGELFFGGLRGLNSFYPEEITDSRFRPPVVLTDFKIFNKPVPIMATGSLLRQHIDETEQIVLPPGISVFSLEFAALNYRSPEKNRYAYIMDPFEKEWNYVDHTRRFVTYTNLKPGEYTFRVKASNNDGIWNETGKSIKVTILPPWWSTWWARISAILIIASAILAIFKIKTYSLKERSKELQKINTALNREISERKILEKKLVHRERLAVLGELAGGIAHELRNPLGAIKNSVYFLNMTLDESEAEMKESLQILNKEIENSESIISSLLDYARAKPAAKKRTNVKEIIQDVLRDLNLPANISMDNRLPDSIPEIMADAGQLGQVFGNIILNAIQAMPDGGELSIFCKTQGSEWLMLYFADTGIGIPEEITRKIFEPLFSTKAKGIGLGMAITKTFVDGHGGRVEVSSEKGKGTTFTVKLPIDMKEGKTKNLH